MENIVQCGWKDVNWDKSQLGDEENLDEGVLACNTSSAAQYFCL